MRLHLHPDRHVTPHRRCTVAASATASLGHTWTRPLRARLAAPPRVALPPPHASPKRPGRTSRMPPCAANRRRDDHRSPTDPPSPLGRYRGQIPFRPPKPKHYYQEEDASDYWSPVSTAHGGGPPVIRRPSPPLPTHHSRPAAEEDDGRPPRNFTSRRTSRAPRAGCRARCPHARRLAPPPPTAARVRPPPPVTA
jgi:hypothetical protein